tara:strand:+ start:576 stop:878 length:303 start_codon:yes stop_codon:yes gene_type:complete
LRYINGITEIINEMINNNHVLWPINMYLTKRFHDNCTFSGVRMISRRIITGARMKGALLNKINGILVYLCSGIDNKHNMILAPTNKVMSKTFAYHTSSDV